MLVLGLATAVDPPPVGVAGTDVPPVEVVGVIAMVPPGPGAAVLNRFRS